MRKVFFIGCLLFSTIAYAQYYSDMDTARICKIDKRDTIPVDSLPYRFDYEWYNPTKMGLTGNLGVGYANLVVIGVLPYARPALEFEHTTNPCFPLTWKTDRMLFKIDSLRGGIYCRGTTDTGHIVMRTYWTRCDSGGTIPLTNWDSVTTVLPIRADTILPMHYFAIEVASVNEKTFWFFTIRRISDHAQDNLNTSIYVGRFCLHYWRVR